MIFTQSCLTLCNPTDHSLPGSSVHGILQAKILEWVAISFSMKYNEVVFIIWFFCKKASVKTSETHYLLVLTCDLFTVDLGFLAFKGTVTSLHISPKCASLDRIFPMSLAVYFSLHAELWFPSVGDCLGACGIQQRSPTCSSNTKDHLFSGSLFL